jgi:hypothetical protein
LLLDAARAFAAADCCVIPARVDGSKAPAVRWEQYQTDLPADEQLEYWFGETPMGPRFDGFGLVCGAVSRGLEMFELEGRAIGLTADLANAFTNHDAAGLWARLCAGYVEQSPSGGLHFLYRVSDGAHRNTKLARRPATDEELAINPADRVKVLVETRGEGGFVITAPSGGRTHETGLSWKLLAGGPVTIPTITGDERDLLYAIANMLDAMPAADTYVSHGSTSAPVDGELRPGDDFNLRAEWDDILGPAGWHRTRKNFAGTGAAWTRPGKEHGVSATTGTASDGVDRFYCFSTSTEFETEKPYSKFAAYALLSHGGDLSAAASALRHDNYGSPLPPRDRLTLSGAPPLGAPDGSGGGSGQGPAAPQPPPPGSPGKPPLNVGNAADMAEWLRVNVGTGPLSGMFARGTEIVHTPREGDEGYVPLSDDARAEDGPAQVRVVKKSDLASRVQYTFDCHKMVKRGKGWEAVSAMFPPDAARVATDVPDMLPNLRRLRGVIHSPVFRPDGTLVRQPGYDVATELLYLPEQGFTVPDVPDEPSTGDVERAVKLLDEMVREFGFTSDHDRANYFGLLLTPLLRTLAPPPYKLGAISSPQPGSGKTLLATIARIIHGGVFRAEVPEDDAELRKQITSMLTVTTGPIVHFDNVSGVLRSSTLAGLLTSATWGDRPLGATEWVGIPNDRLWVITGNNLSLGGDLARRTLWVTIDPGVPNPETRTGFAIKDLETWVTEHRGDLLHALLVLIRAWVVAGRPVDEERGSDGYARWIETVSGVLTLAGVPGTFGHVDSAQQPAGVEDDDWGEFLEAVYGEFGITPWSVKELLSKVNTSILINDAMWPSDRPIPVTALPSELAEKVNRSQSGVGVITKSLGMWLRNRNGRWAGQLTVRNAGERRAHERLWQIEVARAKNGDSGDSGDSAPTTLTRSSTPVSPGGHIRVLVNSAGTESPVSPESPSLCAACQAAPAAPNSLWCDPCLQRARGEAP